MNHHTLEPLKKDTKKEKKEIGGKKYQIKKKKFQCDVKERRQVRG